MATFLLTWNPKTTYWVCDQLIEWAQIFADFGQLDEEDNWSCGRTKSIQPEDRVFLIKLGSEPRGIIASGYSISHVYEGPHWLKKGKKALYVDIRWDVALDPRKAAFELEELKEKVSDHYNWTPQASGQRIPDDIAARLEKEWARFVRTVKKAWQVPSPSRKHLKASFTEGKKSLLLVERSERNRDARNECIRYYGSTCRVCGFNFSQVYGDIGEGFIHVHHLQPLSKSRKRHQVDPIRDLIPVCANCHAMFHHSKRRLTVKKLRDIVEQNKNAARSS